MTAEHIEHSPELRAALNRMWESHLRERDGVARIVYWQAPDGWIIARTTTRVEGGPHDGKWVVQLMRPHGKGARSGSGTEWRETYRRAFATRKAMNARARALYVQHGGRA